MGEKTSEGGMQGKKMAEKSWKESKKMWEIAVPAILTAVTQFSISFVTSAFAGHLGTAELAAVSIVQTVIEAFVFGITLGMGSALETLCGQAVGAGQVNMLGIYLQRSFVITGVTALVLTPVYVFTSPLLKLLRQNKKISELAGKYSMWVIPQLFAYAFNSPIQKFLQAQSKIWVMTVISMVALGLHVFLNWVLVIKLGHGLVGAAIAGNMSWWFVVLAQMVYVVSGFFPDAWTGYSLLAFKSLAGFLKLSLASAVMLWLVQSCSSNLGRNHFEDFIIITALLCFCGSLELWYYTVVILMVGRIRNPEIAVDAISICMNLQLWTLMITLGFNAAVSVRVSNELGAGHPNAAKFSAVVAIITSAVFGIVFTAALLAANSYFPKIFTGKDELIKETSKLGYFLAVTIFLNSVQPVLHGVAVGAGWQSLVALINSACYYIFGIPVGALLGYKFDLGVRGIWSGMLAGCLLQTVILFIIMFRTNWSKEAMQAEERVHTWAGSLEARTEKEERILNMTP
ncbi:protein DETOXIFICATION 33-like isoform X1 [Malania oleifera]|uniref:protein DETOXIFICATION 33-like isoform X1 n=1 Tax=Malania oleifera TaxID=397392 RepID=UPI0025AE5DE0|nr:protein DETOXIFICATION 33-like isoform X1 [Malania oleifera]